MSNILSKHRIKQTETGKYVAIVPSCFSKDYYQSFYMSRLHPSRSFPFRLNGLYEISYQNEADFLLVGRELSQLEKDILVFIARFRNVQKLHIQKEMGSNVSGKRIEKAVQQLCQYFLIETWEFPRQDKPEVSAAAYSISQNGYRLLRYFQLIEQQEYYKQENLFEDDLYQPLRFWKIVDTYQIFKLSAHYKGFLPQKMLAPQPYTIKQTKKKTNSLGEEKKTQTERQIFLRQALLQGELLFENPRLQYVFDLYPLVTETDLEELLLILQHWSVLEDPYRYLVLIVDSWDRVEEVSHKYDLSAYEANILFFDLDSAQHEDLQSSLYQFDADSRSYSLLPFKLRIQ